MARRKPEPPRQARRNLRALTASARVIDVTSPEQVRKAAKRHEEWQGVSFVYRRAIGEIGDPLDYRANVISQVRLFGAVLPPEQDEDPIPVSAAANPEPTEGERAAPLIPQSVADLVEATMAKLNRDDGVPAMLRKIVTNIDLAGDVTVLAEETPDGEIWKAYSVSELTGDDKALKLVTKLGDTKGRKITPAMIFRHWTADPEFGELAISPMRPLIEEGICEELLLISKELRAAAKSRLLKGILWVNSSLSLGPSNPDGATAQADEQGGGGFQQELIDVATDAINSDGSPAQMVPIVVEVDDPKTAAEYTEFGQLLDPKILDRAQYLLERIANAMPLPREISLGMGDVNHWGSHQIERAAFQHYMEPTVLDICHSFTVGFLHPLLKAAGVDQATIERLVVWYDPSDAIVEDDQKEAANFGYTEGAIGGEAWRRVHNFDEDDAPSDEEALRRLGLDRSILTSDISLLLLKLAGIVPQGAAIAEAPPGPQPPAPVELPPAPEPEPDPQEPPPNDKPMAASAVVGAGDRLADIDRGLTERIQAAADAAVEQALVRAGNRLRSMAKRDRAATAALKDVAPEMVAATLGRQWVQRLRAPAEEPDTVEDLLAGSFVALRERFVRQSAAAWSATSAEALSVALPEDRPSQVELDQLDAEASLDAERAGDRLVAALVALASALLFDPNPEVGPGEVDVTSVVPRVIVREAVAMAGGAQAVERTAVGGLVTPDGPVGGIATGSRSRVLFARIRAWWTGYRWDYGDASTRARPFLPHKALAGKVFATWQSPELANTSAEWMGTLTLTPGDHAGCQCAFTPIVIEPTAAEEAA